MDDKLAEWVRRAREAQGKDSLQKAIPDGGPRIGAVLTRWRTDRT